MNINKEGRERQQQKQAEIFAQEPLCIKKETETKLALSSLVSAHKASGWPQTPCTTQMLWCQFTAWAMEWSEAIKTAGGLAEGDVLGAKSRRLMQNKYPTGRNG